MTEKARKRPDPGLIIRSGGADQLSEQLLLVVRLSIPAILSMMTNTVMSYIDAAMVGKIGSAGAAAIGLVSSTTWVFGSLIGASCSGFSVQVAHAVGAGNVKRSKSLFKQALVVVLSLSLFICLLGVFLSFRLPGWLGGGNDILHDAGMYLLIFSLAIPFVTVRSLSASMLRCSGNLLLPSALEIVVCVLDVIFNYFFIFPTHQVILFGLAVTVPGFGLGVAGAALGSVVSLVIVGLIMFVYCAVGSEYLKLDREGSWRPEAETVKTAVKISTPIAAENFIMQSAAVYITRLIAPLGNISLAANSFAVTAEAFCYMPAYGIGEASMTLVGQSLGAKRNDLAKRFAWVTVAIGFVGMIVMSSFMYMLAPAIFNFLTPDNAVAQLGILVLRIVVFVEPLFGVSIIVSASLRGAGDTLIPGILNIVSMWGVRVPLSLFLVGRMGLRGIWIAMSVELAVRGILMMARLLFGKWDKVIKEVS